MAKTGRSTLFRDIHSATVPGWDEALRAFETLRNTALNTTATPEPELQQSLATQLAEEALRPAPKFDALLLAHHQQLQRDQARTQGADALLQAAGIAEQRLNDLEERHMLQVIAAIRERVKDLAAALADLGRVPASAEEALNTGRAEQWAEARTVATEVTGLGMVYEQVVRPAYGEHPHRLAAGFISDPMAHPWFLRRREKVAKDLRDIDHSPEAQEVRHWAATVPASPFSPTYGMTTIHPDRASADAWLAYLIAHDLLTVLDPQEALQRWAAAERATEPVDPANKWNSIAERHTYAQLVGDTEEAARLEELVREHGPSNRRRSA